MNHEVCLFGGHFRKLEFRCAALASTHGQALLHKTFYPHFSSFFKDPIQRCLDSNIHITNLFLPKTRFKKPL